MKITTIAGARPNFMKVAPLMRAFAARGIQSRLVHTGQHYDEKMSQTFFDELRIPRPDVNLEVGSGSHVWQLAEVMKRLEPEFEANRPDALVVVGDVNSTAAATITAVKMDIPVAHVEAGLRSFDRQMPEEINRILTDSISEWLFTSEPCGEKNLRNEGVPAEKIHFVGNVMIDTLLEHRKLAAEQRTHERLELPARGYCVLTLHRPSNVDVPEHLDSILNALTTIAEELPIVFVVHPRTRNRINEFGFTDRLNFRGFRQVEPLGYLSMLSLMDNARLLLTDSGGIQEESTVLGVPCLTLRENTERPITIDVGCNQLVGWQSDRILKAFRRAMDQDMADIRIPEKWDGKAAERIAEILHKQVSASSKAA